MAKSGGFREDLLFRIRTIVIELPPLREVKEDIRDIVAHYVLKFCEQYEIPTKGLAPDLSDALLAYDWPGNVRELIQALEKAIVSAKDEPMLFSRHLPEHIRAHLARASVLRKRAPAAPAQASEVRVGGSLAAFREAGLARLEADYLDVLMKRTKGDISEACRISELSRSRLYALLKRHRIPAS
jgi:two-component system NtrC family response regulator